MASVPRENYDDVSDDLVEVTKADVARLPIRDVGSRLQVAIERKEPYFWSSLPQGSHGEKIAVMRLLSSKDNDIEKIIEPKTFQVKDCILSRISFEDKDGKLVVLPKLVLISPSGESISIISEVWISEFCGLFSMIGSPTWNEPVYVSAQLRKGRGTNQYYSLKVV